MCNKLFKCIPHDSTSVGPDEKANATAKALDMSLQYSFVTPLTSMVVTKPEVEDGTSSPLIADKLTERKHKNRKVSGCVFFFQGSNITAAHLSWI